MFIPNVPGLDKNIAGLILNIGESDQKVLKFILKV
jgi:hypothetical protein